MTAPSAEPTHADLRLRASRWARGSFWMLVVFAVWTVAFVVGSGPVAELLGADLQTSGEVAYIEAWLPWTAVTALWVLPLIVGVALGVVARRRGSGTIAWVGIGMNLVVLAAVVAPATIDRLVNL